MLAMASMTLGATVLGSLAHRWLPTVAVQILAAVAFLTFGCLTLLDAVFKDDDDDDEEETQVIKEISEWEERKKKEGKGATTTTTTTTTTRKKDQKTKKTKDATKDRSRPWMSPVVVQAFVMTFFGEWGDRSQVSQLNLAAVGDPVQVLTGGVLGQGLAMALAAVGGRGVGEWLPERAMGMAGGALFLAFGIKETLAVYHDHGAMLVDLARRCFALGRWSPW